MLELPGAVFFVGMERDARGRWHRSGGGAVLWGGLRGTPEEGGIAPGRDSVGGYY